MNFYVCMYVSVWFLVLYFDILDCVHVVCVCYVSVDKWISPNVTGCRPPPIDDFTLTLVTNNTAALFGGDTITGRSKKLFIISFNKTSVVSFSHLTSGI